MVRPTPQELPRSAGAIPADRLRPRDLIAWIDGPGWGPTTRNGVITAAKRAFAWAARHGHITSDPIAAIKKPRAWRRSRVMDDAQAAAVITSVPDANFRDYLVALRATGARPSEVARVEAAHFVELSAAWVMPSKTTAATGRQRTVHLTTTMVEMSARLAAAHPVGPIFRNTRGNPWPRHATACRFAEIRARLELGQDASAESFRHGFITTAPVGGIPIATVAELAGHRSTAMISRHYSHLADRHEHLKAAFERVRPGDDAGGTAEQ